MAAAPPELGEPIPGLTIALAVILVLVLVLPFASRRVEENLEPFFLAMGLVGVAVTYHYGILDGEGLRELAVKAIKTPLSVSGLPVGITQAVFIFGLIFLYYHPVIYRMLDRMIRRVGLTLFTFIFITVLGMISSVISVIVTAVILSEVVAALKMPRGAKIRFTIYAAFALGLGAALTPIGEPLSTIAVSKLNAPFDYLLRLLGAYVIPGVIGVAAVASLSMRRYASQVEGVSATYGETLRDVVERTVRVFVFVAALELLGYSFTPMVVWYFSKLDPAVLYWVNTISAVVDNATLAAAEIGPYLSEEQIRSALMSLLVSGGMLIPGNIPNIVAAGRLKITMKEWARLGVPFGAALLIIYFIVIEVLGIHITL
ncbi:MAG: DUF1646 family protein [Desulfurococcales archaeon]|nr:DUF1646 family protein [Desulfurococcales archaeon]